MLHPTKEGITTYKQTSHSFKITRFEKYASKGLKSSVDLKLESSITTKIFNLLKYFHLKIG
jgi:hypothetical protein